MAYLMDRRRAVRVAEIVAIVSVQGRGVRSRIILRDNSLYHTLTRPKTLVRYTERTGIRARGGRKQQPNG
jgi:hypothetical protein